MIERFLRQTVFTSQEDYIKNMHINVPENFNFAYVNSKPYIFRPGCSGCVCR